MCLKLHESTQPIRSWNRSIGGIPLSALPLRQTRHYGHPHQNFLAENFTDSRGLLRPDAAFAVDKVDNEIRIATVGGSTTANVNLVFAKLARPVSRTTAQIHTCRKITVANGGTPGFDTSQSIANLALRLMPLSPDVVVIYHAYNDLKAIALDGTFSPDYAHIHHTPFGFRERPPLWEQWLAHSMAYVRIAIVLAVLASWNAI